MEYAMLSTLIPRQMYDQVIADSKGSMQDAANALQWNLYRGLCENLGWQIPLFNILPVGSFPQYYRKAWIKSFPFEQRGQNIGFCNIKLLRNKIIAHNAYKALASWCAEGADEKTLFVYTISQSFMKAVSKLKTRYPDVKVCAIVADLPDMSNLSSKRSLGVRMISYLRAKDSYALLPCVDRFVLLTKHMADRMGLTQPWCVMEGIAAVPEELPEATPTNDPIKTVMYTGTLHKRFGVMHLVEAFSRIEDPQMRLVLCGIGDSEADIRRAAEKDGRISFLGQLKRDEVIRLQRQATVLVNPRPGDEEFTKYSFPSKTMEYLVSGVPVVAYKLAGIEDEYDAYLQYPEDGTVEALADKISQICRLEPQDWARLGAQGRQFVLGQKNARVQSRKILAFCEEDRK